MSIVPGLQFGSGYLLAAPQTTSGNPATNPTPLQVGVIQNIKFSLGAEIKSLFGQLQWPVDSAPGKRTIKGSFEFAQISNILMSQLFLADPVTAGGDETRVDDPYTAVASVVTVAPPFSGVYFADLGVRYAATGPPLPTSARARSPPPDSTRWFFRPAFTPSTRPTPQPRSWSAISIRSRPSGTRSPQGIIRWALGRSWRSIAGTSLFLTLVT